jgi:HEPN domain-containing protein
MKTLTREWVKKAEGDFNTLLREVRARKAPNYDAACFHAQQCVENYSKARLQESEVPFGKTHNFVLLLGACAKLEPLLGILERPILVLNAYSVELRYPGESADREMAKEALAATRSLRKAVRRALGLSAER